MTIKNERHDSLISMHAWSSHFYGYGVLLCSERSPLGLLSSAISRYGDFNHNFIHRYYPDIACMASVSKTKGEGKAKGAQSVIEEKSEGKEDPFTLRASLRSCLAG